MIARLRRKVRAKKWMLGLGLVLVALVIMLTVNEWGVLSILIVNLAFKFVIFAGIIWVWSVVARRLDARAEAEMQKLLDES